MVIFFHAVYILQKEASLLSHKPICCFYAFKNIAIKVLLPEHISFHFPFLNEEVSTSLNLYIHILKRNVLCICYLFFHFCCLNHFFISENVQVLWDITVKSTGNLREKSSSIINVLLFKTSCLCQNVLWNALFELHVSESIPQSQFYHDRCQETSFSESWSKLHAVGSYLILVSAVPLCSQCELVMGL